MNERTSIPKNDRRLFGVSIGRLLGIKLVERLFRRSTGWQQVRNRDTQSAGKAQEFVIGDAPELRLDLGKRPAIDVPSLQTDASRSFVLRASRASFEKMSP